MLFGTAYLETLPRAKLPGKRPSNRPAGITRGPWNLHAPKLPVVSFRRGQSWSLR